MEILPINYSNNELWEYNIASSMWTQKTNCPVFRQHPGNFSLGTYGYISGGISRNGVFKDTYRYAPLQDTWTASATYAGEARYNPVSFSTASYGFMGFGHNINGSHLNDLYKFTPTGTGTWQIVSTYPIRGHFTGISINATTNYMIGVNCNNDTELYTNNLNYYKFNTITGSITSLDINTSNTYANKSLNYLKTGEYAFNLNNNIILGGGLNKDSEISIKPNPSLSYAQLEYNISYIIPIVYESPLIEGTSYTCRICNNIINDTIHVKSYNNIATHSIIQCDTCKTTYSSWYDTVLNATYWIGGFTNNVHTSYVCDGIDYAPLYPEIAKGNRRIEDNYVVTYSAQMKVIT